MTDMRANIATQLAGTKIKNLQLDPNGFCNNKCWFCPVAYMPNPPYHVHNMEVDILERIIKGCVDQRGNLFDPSFRHIWTAHYNEVLLYKHLEEFLKIVQKYDLKTTILSNGTTLTEEKALLLKRYEPVVGAICLNVPAATLKAYASYTGNSEATYNRVMENIQKAMTIFPEKVSNKSFNLMINGVDDDHPDQRQDYLGKNAPKIPFYDLHFQEQEMKKRFPGLHVYRVGGLSDRASHLSRYGVFNHSSIWPKREQSIVGCSAGRMYEWLHVNPRAEPFLCCNDYNFEYAFGDLSKQTVEDAWKSEAHIDTILKSLAGICRTCGAAKIGSARIKGP